MSSASCSTLQIQPPQPPSGTPLRCSEGHRGSAGSPAVVYELLVGMPVGGGHFEGLLEVTERFLVRFHEAFDVRFVAEEFIAAGEHVVAIGRIEGPKRS